MFSSIQKNQKFLYSSFDNKVLKTNYSIYSSKSSRKDLAIIFAHGLFSNASIFDPFLEEAAALCAVIVPNLIGRNPSDYAFSSKYYKLEKYISNYLSIISASGFKKIIWVGTSTGAVAGIKIASMVNSPIKAILIDDHLFYEDRQSNTEDRGKQSETRAYQKESVNLRYHDRNYSFADVNSIIKRLKNTDSEISQMDCFKFVVDNFNIYDNEVVPSYDKNLLNSEEDISMMKELEEKWLSLTCPRMLLKSQNSKSFTEISFKKMFLNKNINIYHYKQNNKVIKFKDEIVEIVVKWMREVLPFL